MLISVDADSCTGCRACEVACSLQHTGECRPSRSAVRVLDKEGLGVNIPVLCMQCADAPCIAACLRDALYRADASSPILVKDESCNGCRLCLKACPLGAFHFPRETKKAVKCDLCGGNPQCVEFCASHALSFGVVAGGGRPSSANVWDVFRSGRSASAKAAAIRGELKL